MVLIIFVNRLVLTLLNLGEATSWGVNTICNDGEI
jgi:hypothetical protein